MHYQDLIYGRTTITEPVLIKLLDTAVLQRFKVIMQHGISGLIGITAKLSPPFSNIFFSPLLWFSDLIYERLLSRQPDHLLCQLPQLLDFRPLEAACAAYHAGNGAGRPVTHPVPQLLRAMLVKYLYGCSLRELEEKIGTVLVGAAG